MNFELCASMMCADFGNLYGEVRALEAAGIDSFHIDIMDGRYVPNFAMSLNDMAYIASVTSKPLDVHLMIEHPNTHIELFLEKLSCSFFSLKQGYAIVKTVIISRICLPY